MEKCEGEETEILNKNKYLKVFQIISVLGKRTSIYFNLKFRNLTVVKSVQWYKCKIF